MAAATKCGERIRRKFRRRPVSMGESNWPEKLINPTGGAMESKSREKAEDRKFWNNGSRESAIRIRARSVASLRNFTFRN